MSIYKPIEPQVFEKKPCLGSMGCVADRSSAAESFGDRSAEFCQLNYLWRRHVAGLESPSPSFPDGRALKLKNASVILARDQNLRPPDETSPVGRSARSATRIEERKSKH